MEAPEEARESVIRVVTSKVALTPLRNENEYAECAREAAELLARQQSQYTPTAHPVPE